MSLSLNDINRTMLMRYIEQLRYENRLLKARLMKISKETDKEEDDEEPGDGGEQPPTGGGDDTGGSEQPPTGGGDDPGEDEPTLPPGEGIYDEAFPATDSWFDIGSWKYMVKESSGNKYLRIMINDTSITEIPEDLPLHVITDKDGTKLEVTNMSYMFNNCSSLTSVDLSAFDTSGVTAMHNMFYNCSSLASINLGSFNTASVTRMEYMFYNCSSLTDIDLDSFNTTSVTNMSHIFDGCSGLTSLDLSKFNTSQVTDMSYMFNSCSNLTSLDLSTFDTSRVTNMSYMFDGCSGLTSLDLSSFNTSLVTNMSYMFYGCSNLFALNLSSFDTSEAFDTSYMFYRCSGLTSLDLSSFDTSKVFNMSDMFDACMALESITLNKGASSIVKELPSATWAVINNVSISINTVNIKQGSSANWSSEVPEQWTNAPWKLSHPAKILTDVEFDGDGKAIEGIWVYNIIADTHTVKVERNLSAFTGIVSNGAITLGYDDMPYEILITKGYGVNYSTVSYNALFNGLPTTVTSVSIDDWTNRNVTDMSFMFANNIDLKSLSLGDNFNTGSVTDMSFMFASSLVIESLSLGANFNTSKVTDMSNMFYESNRNISITLYQSSSSIIKALRSATWTIKNNKSTEVNTVTVSQGSSVIWTQPEPTTWTLVPWTLSRTI